MGASGTPPLANEVKNCVTESLSSVPRWTPKRPLPKLMAMTAGKPNWSPNASSMSNWSPPWLQRNPTDFPSFLLALRASSSTLRRSLRPFAKSSKMCGKNATTQVRDSQCALISASSSSCSTFSTFCPPALMRSSCAIKSLASFSSRFAVSCFSLACASTSLILAERSALLIFSLSSSTARSFAVHASFDSRLHAGRGLSLLSTCCFNWAKLRPPL
mmetsp:Transcript_104181/g.293802  ORF Transcript_104181/g.293802 Transcript_104181/m.293802 type:complete len:216 (-) Transcript_104181:403-1050(-)